MKSASINKISAEQFVSAGANAPKYAKEMVPLERRLTLTKLVSEGLWVVGTIAGRKVKIAFRRIGTPFRFRGETACRHGYGNGCQCGYWAVKVESEFGTRSLLYYDPKSGFVAGVIGVREERRVQREENTSVGVSQSA